MPARRGRALLAAQVALVVVALWFAGRTILRQWREFSGQPLVVHPNWLWLVASAVVTVATYAALVQTWRAILQAWHAALPFWTAARIWSVSNLGRYVPGMIWQIGAMGALAQQEGVSATAAAGSAILSTIVNIAAGIAVAMVAGWATLGVLSQGHQALGIVLLAAAAAGLGILPFAMPQVLRVSERLLRRPVPVATLPPRAVLYAIAGNVVAWVLYGLAFEWFVRGLLGVSSGSFTDYVAVWAACYVIGYFFIFLPAGVGPRDAALVVALPALHLTTPPQALLVAVASRLWLTVLEIVPGLVFLLVYRRSRIDRQSPRPTPGADPAP